MIFVALSTFSQNDRRPLELLEGSGFKFHLHKTGKRIDPEELISEGAGATVIIAGVEPYEAKTLDRLPILKCISRCGAGVDAIDLAAARERGITILNTPTIPTQAVAELALAMFLSLSRKLRQQSNLMNHRRWERLSTHLLAGRIIGLFGFGRIGRRVAELSQAFGAQVIAYDPKVEADVARKIGVTMVDREQLLRTADIVSLHASNDMKQPVLIGAEELSLMKDGTILVNLARGSMVDEQAVVEALHSGRLAGAGFDVFSVEPYIGPLCDFEQVILTPHSATMTLETRVMMELQCAENAVQFLRGKISPQARVI